MNSKRIITLVLICAGLATASADSKKLEAQAKVSRAEAEKAALAKVPGGTVKEAELEEEDGKLIWSFDIAKPGAKDIIEVEVDAKTGAVLKVDDEGEQDEAAEKEKDKK